MNSFAEMKNYNSGFLFLSIILMIFFFSVAASEKMDAAELSEKQYAKWRATKEEMRFFGTAVSGLGIYSVFSELFNPIGSCFFSDCCLRITSLRYSLSSVVNISLLARVNGKETTSIINGKRRKR